MKTTVWITTQFAACHRWPEAEGSVQFLSEYHRHQFHVKLGVTVSHGNREVEFIQLKKEVDEFIDGEFKNRYFTYSCEMIAEILAKRFQATFVEVSEDGENGATVVPNPVLDFVKDKCFIGTEAEGPHRGKRVLFVPGKTSAERFRSLWRRYLSASPIVNRVYYGAGNDRDLQLSTLDAIEKQIGLPPPQLDIECDRLYPKEVIKKLAALRNAGATLIYCGDKPPFDVSYIKSIVANTIIWSDKYGNGMFTTSCDDHLFALDQFVEE